MRHDSTSPGPRSGPIRTLLEGDERFRMLVESVRDYAIFMLDSEGFVTTWNSGAEAIKGYTAGEVIGRHFSCFYEADAVASGWPDRELEVAAAAGRFEDEGWRLRKDGSRFWANVVINAIRDAEGRLQGFAKITRDLTDRRRMARLEADRVRIDEFLAILAHELRNPLAPIRNAAGALGHHPSAETATWAAGILARQASQLTRLVDDLLDSARIASGNIEVRRRPMNLLDAVGRAVEAIAPVAEARDLRLQVELSQSALPVAGDLPRLAQAVNNLLSNAVKYSPPGGRVLVSVRAEGEYAVVRVEDDGAGISPDLMPSIFDLFTQGRRTLDRAEGGLGIGLAVVKRIAELHAGDVCLSSLGVDRGTTALFRLPLLEAAIVPELSPEPSPETPASLRILVVDDNQDSAETMAALLAAWGHSVRGVADGPAALAAAPELRPQVVLLDIGLPGMDGYSVARRLRAMRLEPEPLLVAMTGYGREEDRAASRQAGFDHHLVKPIDPHELESILRD